VGVGGTHPIRIQSMTTTDTQDTEATVAQVQRLVRVGCEIVRITAPSLRDAENLGPIRAALLERGVQVPLVADIHFTPKAALLAAEHVEKVRVNPGNFADKKKFEVREYSDAQYQEELERVHERFAPLVRRCKELGRALRIGTNHGSLSDRIMNRFGDTPAGMVESALEFLDVCLALDFHDVVFSMKASNPRVAVQAYRMLAARLEARAPGEPSYPFHVGVTEAGDGAAGRVKSAIGIGSLLEDGLGDTIRVSLTEDPVKEVPVARALAARYDAWREVPSPEDPGVPFVEDPYAHVRRASVPTSLAPGGLEAGGEAPVRVEVDLGPAPGDASTAAEEVATALAALPDLALEGLGVTVRRAWEVSRVAALREALRRAGLQLPLAVRVPASLARAVASVADRVVLELSARASEPPPALSGTSVEWLFVAEAFDLPTAVEAALSGGGMPSWVSVEATAPVHAVRWLVARLRARGGGEHPLVLRHWADASSDPATAALRAATALGAPLCDGLGDLVSLGGLGSVQRALSLAYRILQGARQRTSWTEFISCPSCGRTLFDLEETTARIKARTQHLPGLKIAVMGCIVNGPGEMADADFGYVGSGPGRVNLYVGRECVVRSIPEAGAPERLVALIREHGRWQEPA